MELEVIMVRILGCRELMMGIGYLEKDGKRFFRVRELVRYVAKRVDIATGEFVSFDQVMLYNITKWIVAYLGGRDFNVVTRAERERDMGYMYDFHTFSRNAYVEFDHFCEALEALAEGCSDYVWFFQCMLEFLYCKSYIGEMLIK